MRKRNGSGLSSAPGPKRNKKTLTLEDKVKVIDAVETGGKTYQEIANLYQIGVSTVSDIYRNKIKISSAYGDNINPKTKRLGNNDFQITISQRVNEWMLSARARNITVTGEMLKEKALHVAKSLDPTTSFTASNGWLHFFKRQHQISSKALSGESRSMNVEVVNDWQRTLDNVCAGYLPKDIWNCDETGLYFRGLPNRSLVTRSDDRKGVKLSKDRITVLLSTSMEGEKLLPLVIGNAKMPRSFQKKYPEGISWYYNKNAWMQTSIFQRYLEELNTLMMHKNRSILLFLDNAPVHCTPTLSNVKLVFFPKNTTAGTQPLDAGIIRNFKLHYRKFMMQSILNAVDDDSAELIAKRITIGQAIEWIKRSWKEKVTPETIRNCWQKVGFFPTLLDSPPDLEQINPNSEIEEEIAELASDLLIDDPLPLCEENPPVYEENDDWEEDILFPEHPEEIITEAGEEEDESDIYSGSVPTLRRIWKEFRGNIIKRQSPYLMPFLTQIDEAIYKISKENTSQSTITEYFETKQSN